MSTALMAPRKKRNTKGAAIAQAIVYYDEMQMSTTFLHC